MNRSRIGSQLARSLVETLGDDCGLAAVLLRLLVARPGAVVTAEALASAGPISAVRRVAEDFVRRGWLTQENAGWRSPQRDTFPEGLASFLDGAAAMRVVFPTDSRATAVVTMPPAPSVVSGALPTTGVAYAALLNTEEAFERIADAATSSLTIMTPFLNVEGLGWALAVFRRSRALRRVLVVRAGSECSVAMQAHRESIVALAVSVLDYTVPVPDGGYETFHAKVVLADASLAYVGSANLLAYVRQSMELGILADGKAARAVASVVRAVESFARPYEW